MSDAWRVCLSASIKDAPEGSEIRSLVYGIDDLPFEPGPGDEIVAPMMLHDDRVLHGLYVIERRVFMPHMKGVILIVGDVDASVAERMQAAGWKPVKDTASLHEHAADISE